MSVIERGVREVPGTPALAEVVLAARDVHVEALPETQPGEPVGGRGVAHAHHACRIDDEDGFAQPVHQALPAVEVDAHGAAHPLLSSALGRIITASCG